LPLSLMRSVHMGPSITDDDEDFLTYTGTDYTKCAVLKGFVQFYAYAMNFTLNFTPFRNECVGVKTIVPHLMLRDRITR